jgi:hypothetical protein
MPTKPRELSNTAREARDRAAEAANAGLLAMGPLLDLGPMTEGERMRRVALGVRSLTTVVRGMEFIGAQTRPLDQ